MAANTDWAAIGYVTASDYRTRIVDALTDGPATPSTLATRTELHVSHVSRTLTELQDEDLVELLVPEDQKKGRYYGLTEAGEDVAAEVDA